MTFPNNYLASGSQPWGREVQKRIELAEATIARNEKNNDARDTQLASSQARLSDQLIKTNSIAVQANQTAVQASATAQQATAGIELANEALTQIQYILGILNEPTPPSGSNTATGVTVGPSFSFDNYTLVSLTLTPPTAPASANLSASVNLWTNSEISGYPMSGDFYITDGTTANTAAPFYVSSTAMQTNNYTQGYVKTYTNVSSIILYVKINSIQALVDEGQEIGATLSASVTWL